MTPEYPVRIVSDLHYKIPGARLKTKDDLRPLFAGARTVILGGDSVDGGRVVVNLGAHMKGFRSAVIEIEGPDVAPVFIGDKRVELSATPTP